MRSLLRKVVPKETRQWIRRQRRIGRETKALAKLEVIDCSVGDLGVMDQNKLNEIFLSKDIDQSWQDLEDQRNDLNIPDLTGGVNPGDQRAVYYLAKGLKAGSVLEIGTLIGSSTAYLALAMKDVDHPKIVTVDIDDVNDQVTKPWLARKSSKSPRELVSGIIPESAVEFVVDSSIDFMSNCDKKFDLIFLDGDHTAVNVYREIPLALKLLNPGGVILLHDFFPGNNPLWPLSKKVCPGPFLATNRLENEGLIVEVLPLGSLPWETKYATNITSLAILSAKNPK